MTQIFTHTDLPEEYSQTVFESSLPTCEWPAQFAIVTAYNPRGKSSDLEENQQRDRALHELLDSRGERHWCVTGGSPDRSHQEPGYGIQITFDAAVALGRKVQQEAIFWIDNNELTLVSCATSKSVSLGRFKLRLTECPNIAPPNVSDAEPPQDVGGAK